MTVLNYEEFDKATIINLLFKNLETRLANTGRTWTATHLFKVKCYAQDARDYFRDILLQSLQTSQDYRVDNTCYPSITSLYPSFTSELGDPFEAVCLVPGPEDHLGRRQEEQDSNATDESSGMQAYSVSNPNSELQEQEYEAKGVLESVEKLAVLILFSEHMIAYCDSRWKEVDTSGIDYVALVNGVLEDDARAVEKLDAAEQLVLDLEPLFEDKLTLSQSQSLSYLLGSGRGLMDPEEVMNLVESAQSQEADALQGLGMNIGIAI